MAEDKDEKMKLKEQKKDDEELDKKKKAVDDKKEDLEKEETEDDEDKKKSIDDEESEEEEDKKKKKKAKKGESGGHDPEAEENEETNAEHTISPGQSTPSSPQNTFVPQSNIDGKREQTTPMGKEAPNEELLKSPLFTNLNKQLNEMKKSFEVKLEALEKSFKDRSENLQKSVGKIEEFYKKPFYKAVDENVAPEGVIKKGISEQIREGKVTYRD